MKLNRKSVSDERTIPVKKREIFMQIYFRVTIQVTINFRWFRDDDSFSKEFSKNIS